MPRKQCSVAFLSLTHSRWQEDSRLQPWFSSICWLILITLRGYREQMCLLAVDTASSALTAVKRQANSEIFLHCSLSTSPCTRTPLAFLLVVERKSLEEFFSKEREISTSLPFISNCSAVIQHFPLSLSNETLLIKMGKNNSKNQFNQWDLDRFSNVTGNVVEIFFRSIL